MKRLIYRDEYNLVSDSVKMSLSCDVYDDANEKVIKDIEERVRERDAKLKRDFKRKPRPKNLITDTNKRLRQKINIRNHGHKSTRPRSNTPQAPAQKLMTEMSVESAKQLAASSVYYDV